MRSLLIMLLLGLPTCRPTASKAPSTKTTGLQVDLQSDEIRIVVIRGLGTSARRVVKPGEKIELSKLEPGQYSVQVFSLNGKKAYEGQVTVQDGKVSVLGAQDVKKRPSLDQPLVDCVVYGTIKDATGPLPYAEATIHHGKHFVTLTADKDGYFLAEGIPCDTIKVVVHYELVTVGTFTQKQTEIQLTPGVPKETFWRLETGRTY